MNQVQRDVAITLVQGLIQGKIPIKVINGVSHEAQRAVREHPSNRPSARRLLIAMCEAGEVAEAMAEGRVVDAIEEAEQTAAMFMRLAAKLHEELESGT